MVAFAAALKQFEVFHREALLNGSLAARIILNPRMQQRLLEENPGGGGGG